jgi:hypothetical protein
MNNDNEVTECNCEERFMTTVEGNKRKRRRIPAPSMIHYHDCTYVAERNRMIPHAQALAHSRIGDTSDGNKWTRFFANAMEELWREHLQSTS